jgi:hypothetical protein
MSQGLKYLKEENMKEIIASYTFHATMNTLSNSKYAKSWANIEKHIKQGRRLLEVGLNGHTK